MHKFPLAIMLGITADMGFAAACVLRALFRHSPRLDAHILLYTDGGLPAHDAGLLRGLGAELREFSAPPFAFLPQAIRQFSPLSLARFEGFRLLAEYHTVIWLDVDIAIQDDISGLADYGPFSLAREDPFFTPSGKTSRAGINVNKAVPGLDSEADNYNSGILVLQDSLPNPEALYPRCLGWMEAHAPCFDYIDQGVLNMLAQELSRSHPPLFQALPYARYNAHPRNPHAWKAAIVHAFGAYKLWDDGLTRCCFPEWQRDYEHWLDAGGSPWRGQVENGQFLEGGAFSLLTRLHDTTEKAQTGIEHLNVELTKERALREKMEMLLRRMAQ